MSLYELLIRSLHGLALPKIKQQNHAIAEVAISYFNNLTECCIADYQRNIAPRTLKHTDIYRTEPDTLLNVTRQMVTLRHEIEAFLDRFHEDASTSVCKIGRGRESCRLLSQLTEDSERLISFCHNEQRSFESESLGQLMQA